VTDSEPLKVLHLIVTAVVAPLVTCLVGVVWYLLRWNAKQQAKIEELQRSERYVQQKVNAIETVHGDAIMANREKIDSVAQAIGGVK